MSYKVHSVLIPREKFNQIQALQYMYDNKYPLKKMHISNHFYRFRLLTTAYLKKIGYNNTRTDVLPNGIELIIFYNEE